MEIDEELTINYRHLQYGYPNASNQKNDLWNFKKVKTLDKWGVHFEVNIIPRVLNVRLNGGNRCILQLKRFLWQILCKYATSILS